MYPELSFSHRCKHLEILHPIPFLVEVGQSFRDQLHKSVQRFFWSGFADEEKVTVLGIELRHLSSVYPMRIGCDVGLLALPVDELKLNHLESRTFNEIFQYSSRSH